MQVTVDSPDLAASVEVVVADGVRETVLARYRVGLARAVPVAARVPPYQGSIDQPQPSQVVKHRALPVFGWIVMDGEGADVVDVFVDDLPAVRARRCEPRPDLVGMAGISPAVAYTAGYSAMVVLPKTADARTALVRVQARGASGQLWEPAPVRVQISPADADSVPPLGPPGALARVLDVGVLPSDGRPRVCVFTHSLQLGGGELYLQELLLRLTEVGAADFLIIAPEDGPLRPQLEAGGLTVHVTHNYSVDASRYEPALAELAALVASWGSDVVLANTLGVFPGVDAALRLGIPVIWAIHESFPLDVFSLIWGPSGLHPSLDRRWRECLATTEHVVFESEATLEMFRREEPRLSGRCVHYGVDQAAISRYEQLHERDQVRARLGFGADHRVLLCMGVFLDRKSQVALVNAFADVARSCPGARLVLVGDHPSEYACAVHRITEERGVSDVVRLQAIDPDTYQWYFAADVLVSASDIESLPRSVLEAMTFGVPALAVDVFGLSEVIVDGRNGWLCSPRSGSALMAGLRRTLAVSADELAEISAQARVDAKAFDGQNYAATYRDLIDDCARRRRAASASAGRDE